MFGFRIFQPIMRTSFFFTFLWLVRIWTKYTLDNVMHPKKFDFINFDC